MPQMAPYNWLMLFFMLHMILYFMISSTHFYTIYKLYKCNFIPQHYFTWMW